jgi:hypothetical protein
LNTRIHLRTNFSYESSENKLFELPSSVHTVADLLNYMGNDIRFAFLDADTGNLRQDIEVTLNNKDIAFYPNGLQRSFVEHDTLAITLIPLGGG